MTGSCAFPAECTFRLVVAEQAVCIPAPCARRADGYAAAAPDAPVGMTKKDGLRGHAFRVMAPPAGKGTSLQEDRRPYARAVVDRVLLEVENDAALHRLFPFSVFLGLCRDV